MDCVLVSVHANFTKTYAYDDIVAALTWAI
jgi:hypothetical protein